MNDVPDDHEVDPYHGVTQMAEAGLVAAQVDALSWSQLTGDEDASAYVDRLELERLAREAKARADAATEGPWGHKAGMLKHYVFSADEREDFGFSQQIFHWEDGHEVPTEANCIFVAHARADVPILADAVLRLLEENRRLRGKVQFMAMAQSAGPLPTSALASGESPRGTVEERWENANPKWKRMFAELQRRYSGGTPVDPRAACPIGHGAADACFTCAPELQPDDEPSVGDVHGYGGAK